MKSFATKHLGLSETEYVRCLEESMGSNNTLLHVMAQRGLVDEQKLVEALAEVFQFSRLVSEDIAMQAMGVEGLSIAFMRHHNLVVFRVADDGVVLAMADPFDFAARDSILESSFPSARVQIDTFSHIQEIIENIYGSGASSLERIVEDIDHDEYTESGVDLDADHLKDLATEAPVVRLVSLIISNAIKIGASDIHFEPFETRFQVRYRIDGVLAEVESPPKALQAAVISRLKIMAKLDIAERRLPQDGRIRLRIMGKDVDFRVSTLPANYGESVVLRVLDKESTTFDLSRFGMPEGILSNFDRIIHYPYGMVLVTGPTGSGKTTTLYATLSRLNSVEKKIITVEDPIEYQIDGINQVQVKPQIGLSFANGLRSIVRQDPDIILVGEIRDPETAEIAIQSALTGHLVFSTLHTNDAPGAVARLFEMGIEPYLLSSSLLAVMAQRLVRVNCDECVVAVPLAEEEFNLLGLDAESWPWRADLRVSRGKRCKACNSTGYRGRTGIYEFMPVDDELRDMISQRTPTSTLRRKARDKGLKTLREAGWGKVLNGITTLDEVLRVTIQE
jgi:general secretion pathway protein E